MWEGLMPAQYTVPGLEFDAWLIDTNPIANSDFSFVLGYRTTCVIFPTVEQLGFSRGGARGDVYKALRALGASTIESQVAIRAMPLVSRSYGVTTRLWTDDVHPNKEPALFGFRVRMSRGGRMVCHHDTGFRSDMLAPSVRVGASLLRAPTLQ